MDIPKEKKDVFVANALFVGRELKRMYTELSGAGYSEDEALVMTTITGLRLAETIIEHGLAIAEEAE